MQTSSKAAVPNNSTIQHCPHVATVRIPLNNSRPVHLTIQISTKI